MSADPPNDHDNEDLLAGDPLLAALRDLPVPPLDDLSAERIRRLARAALDDQVRLARSPPPPSRLERIWSRAVMPALVAATVCIYFGWAVRAAADLYR